MIKLPVALGKVIGALAPAYTKTNTRTRLCVADSGDPDRRFSHHFQHSADSWQSRPRTMVNLSPHLFQSKVLALACRTNSGHVGYRSVLCRGTHLSGG